MVETAEVQSSPETDDLFMVLCQSNAKRQVKIQQVSEELAKALGRMRSEMEGRELSDFLGDKAADMIADYLEYEDDSDDVDTILTRVREFKLKHHNGEELLFAQRLLREPAREGNHWFRVMLKDERRQIEDQSLQVLLRENLAGVIALDEATGLADRTTCERYLEQIHAYVKTEHVKACFAVIRMDRYEKSLARYGKSGCEELLQHIARNCKAKFRDEDLVSRLSDQTIGLLLMDATPDTARVVLNRLRWFIASHHISFGGKSNFSVTVSVAFKRVGSDHGDRVLADCEQAIDGIHSDERNQLVEAAG